MVHGQDFVSLKSIGKSARHHQPVSSTWESRGRTHVVFQHQEIASLGVAHQVDAGDVDVDTAWDINADHFSLEMLARIDQVARNTTVFQNPLLPVNVLKKQV